MLFSVSTLKDSVDNVRRFVARNLTHGIDHMFVFLDEPQVEVARYLASQPAVTIVDAHGEWWGDSRPNRLNQRQNTNADVAKALLAELAGDHWLFHIDGDEVVALDRGQLEALPWNVRVVHLTPLEAVSVEEPASQPTRFKRLLTDQELHLLKQLQLINRPANNAYFHGHVGGKAGFRPALDLRAGTHQTLNLDDERIKGFTASWLEHLHLESESFAEFRRKWLSLIDSGPTVKIRPLRASTYDAVAALRNLDLPDDVAESYLRELYRRTVQDPLRELLELDPDAEVYEPRGVASSDLESCRDGLRALRREPKAVFRFGSAQQVREKLATARRR